VKESHARWDRLFQNDSQERVRLFQNKKEKIGSRKGTNEK